MLPNRSSLCHCDIESTNPVLHESLAACKNSSNDFILYFTVNIAFINYVMEKRELDKNIV